MKVANSPLFLEDSHLSENSNKISRGSIAKRSLILKNIGDRRAEVDIWIAATDHKSDPLLRWCTFSEKNPLSIEAKESKEVTLNFQIPQQATPDLYHYEILMEAAVQYPGKIFRRPQQLQVLSSDLDAELSNEPEYSIQPITNSTNPLPLKAGEQLEVKVKVENRSKRVDSFYLNCPELQPEWYTVRYPESDLDIPGLVEETDGLELNPGSAGEITLILHPPQYTPAGDHFPTINLISSNREDLVHLDVVYLQILADDRLNVEMRPLSRKVPEEAGEFELELTNQGNIRREITIRAKDEEELFAYRLQPSAVQLSPGEKQKVALKVKPKKWWCRHWRGKGLRLPFDIELENTVPEEQLFSAPALPENLPQGTVVWQSRPWWQLLLILLALSTTIGGVGFAIWLKYFSIPKVIEFESIPKEYQEGKDKDIGLQWQISHPPQVKKVTLIRLQGNRETDRKNYLFPDKEKISNNFKLENATCQSIDTKLPSEGKEDKQGVNSLLSGIFSPLMRMKDQLNKSQDVVCQATIPNNQKAGNYTFKIEVFAKPNPEQVSSSQITDTITIKPRILPKISDFSSTYPAYEEINRYSSSSLRRSPQSIPPQSINGLVPAPILLNWEISSFNLLKELRIIGRAPDGSINIVQRSYDFTNNPLPPELRRFCQPQKKLAQKTNLVCKNVPIEDAIKAGDYIFTLTVISESDQEESKKTDTIKVQPLPVPKITDFSSTKPSYQEVSAASQFSSPIHLNWNISHPGQIQKLKIVGLAPDGSINSQQKIYPIINNRLPAELQKLCTLTSQNLRCQNVPTDAKKAGDYTFTLTVIPAQGQEKTEIKKDTAKIKIQPLPVNIVYFKINDEDVIQKPKHTFLIDEQPPDANIVVSWKVENGEDIKVELLPAPGNVGLQGSMKYRLSQLPGSETITLKVTNKTGEQKIQSVVIETVE